LKRDRNWQPAPEVHEHSAVRAEGAGPMAPMQFGSFGVVGPFNRLPAEEGWIKEHDKRPWGLALRWRSGDRSAAVIVTDDGRVLKALYLTRSSRSCALPEFYLQYRAHDQQLTPEKLEAMVRSPSPCLGSEQHQALLREFTSARVHLHAAMVAMRRRAETQFGTLERCSGLSGTVHSALQDRHCSL
jgi:hypothetical protein